MNSRERVQAALEHQEADRVPFDFGGTPFSGMHITAIENLRRYLGLPQTEVKTWDTLTQLGVIDDDLLDRLESDCRNMGPRSSFDYHMVFRDEGDYSAFTDEWGVAWRMPKKGGFYYDMYYHPMADANTISDLKDYKWPDPLDDNRFVGVRAQAQAARDQGKTVVLGGFCAGITEMHAWLRGFINYFMDFHLNPSLAEYIMDQVTERKMAYWERMLAEVGDLADVMIEADDMAGQDNVLISPTSYRQYIKPRHTKLFNYMKAKAPHVKVFFHTCGAIRPFIPDLIESGVEILNPVQKSAAGMDLVELKKEFGNDVTFWGGGVDTQRVLPHGTPAEVRDDVRRNIEALAPGGGFVFATIHDAQADVPPENFMAMWETLQEYGVY